MKNNFLIIFGIVILSVVIGFYYINLGSLENKNNFNNNQDNVNVSESKSNNVSLPTDSIKIKDSINTQKDIQIYGVIDKTIDSPFGDTYFKVREYGTGVQRGIYKIFYDEKVSYLSNDCGGNITLIGIPVPVGECDNIFYNFKKQLDFARSEWYGEVETTEFSRNFGGYFIGKEIDDGVIRLEKFIKIVN